MMHAKRFLLPAVATLVCLFATVTGGWAGKSTLALFNLRPTNMEAMGFSGEILFTMISALESQKSIVVMPRREMEEILYQKGLTQGDNPAAVAQAGKVLGVDFVLFGQVTETAGSISTRLQLMDVKNGQVRKSWSPRFGGRDDIMARVPAFADELAASMASGASPSPAGAGRVVAPVMRIDNLSGTSQRNRVIITWRFDDTQPIAGFHLYRSETVSGPYQFMGGTKETRYEDESVKTGSTYFYRIGILTLQGQEVKGPRTLQVTHSGEKSPHPPLVMDGTGYVRRIAFKFVPSLQNQREKFKITRYNIHRKGGADGAWRKVLTMEAGSKSQYDLNYTVEDKEALDDGLAYDYAVSSIDQKGRESAFSDPVTFTTIARPVLVLKRDDLLRKIDFTWKGVSQVNGYRLYRKEENGEWKKVGERKNGQSAELTDKRGLIDGTAYTYYITAYDKAGETGPSETVSGRTKDLPTSPENVRAEGGLVKSVQLSWQPIDDPDVGGYAVYRGTGEGRLDQIAKVRGHEKNAYLDKGSGFTSLEDGKTYSYAVEAYNRFDADGELSNVVSATTKPRPKAVQDLTAAPSGQAVAVTWAPNMEPDIRSNALYRRQDQGSWSKLEALTPDRTRFEDTDLKPDVTYRYQLIAEDADGLKSDPAQSNTVASPLAPPEG
jgi:fibronectin type 3 domain-containing protein/TolB-like protein